jgi:undecaprenyl phosphate-alpha-L-ara4N flippase subunit ArnF
MSARGLSYAAASVALVSAAQLAMRWSMTRLPALHELPLAAGASIQWLALAVLATGVCGYAASLLCWLRALADLPLNRAYSLLSLSYPLVYLSAALLPGLGGSLSAGKTGGVILILAGVLLINARPAAPGPHAGGDNRRK